MIDSKGLVVQENGDGGDCPCRSGVVIGWNGSQSKPAQYNGVLAATQANLVVASNIYIRYPTTYNQPSDFSRDQASRLMLGYGMSGRQDLVSAYYSILVKNYLRHPNGDFIGLGEIIGNIRTLNKWYLYPVLLLLDAKFLIDIISYKWQPWDTDNLFVMDLYLANKKYRTPLAWLAAKLYNKSAAAARITSNLLDPAGNPCIEAGHSNLWFLSQL